MPINDVVTHSTQVPPIGVASLSAMPPFGVIEIRNRTKALQEILRSIMQEGTHYGTVPCARKPSLWKAGAEVLCMAFRLAPILESRITVDDPDAEWVYQGHREDGAHVVGTCTGFFEIEAACTIHGPSGETLSRCSARCNNREGKYRSLGFFDVRNTILKMSEKRAFVSAVLMATGGSDLFTQDLEDFPELLKPDLPEIVATVPPPESTAPRQKAGPGLSPKRKAWVVRAAQEAKLPPEALDRCLKNLRQATPTAITAFFDDLAKRKNVFGSFLALAG